MYHFPPGDRYKNLRLGPGEFNYGFWGQECGPEKDHTWKQIHKYMEDAVSMNTSTLFRSTAIELEELFDIIMI